MDKQNAQNRKNTTHENCGHSQDAQNTTTQTQTQKQNKNNQNAQNRKNQNHSNELLAIPFRKSLDLNHKSNGFLFSH